MEVVLLANGTINYRIEDNFGDYEDVVVTTLPLTDSYWRDTLRDWGIYDENEISESSIQDIDTKMAEITKN